MCLEFGMLITLCIRSVISHQVPLNNCSGVVDLCLTVEYENRKVFIKVSLGTEGSFLRLLL